MKRCLLLATAMVILATNAWVLVSAHRNQRQPVGGTLRLTERELALAEFPAESTVTILRLQWDVPSESSRWNRLAVWLNAAKLAELGFDCHVPVDDPDARRHYGSLTPRPAFIVLEFEGDAWRQAPPDRKSRTRLFAVDAGCDALPLRARYADTNRYAMVRGTVRLVFEDRNPDDAVSSRMPRLGGSIETLMPSAIFVPQPHRRALAEFRRPEPRPPEDRGQPPRYAVTVSWGAHYEPWVRDVVRLP
ncbi:MAG TPA: DUF4824 family protein [Verrucomicrobiota bacterium]|nr:DUF4824 family protein [Verrucomicrobiota bacterium]HNU51872.1 DUF4824 family protein [Verrucomicrobiota bacterium]